ncbi:MAG: ABC transporter permease [Cyclobacteriaceae bacterium]
MNKRPPKFLLRFFRWFCHPDLQVSIEGDLTELYEERRKDSGRMKANSIFFWDVLLLLRPDIIRPIGGYSKQNNIGMINNYIKVGARNINRNKAFSALNITGLSIGIACCVLISIYVKNELSYDTYNSQYDHTYRVLHHFGGAKKAELASSIPLDEYQVWGVAPVSEAIQDYYPEIKSVFRFTTANPWLVEYEHNRFQENNIIFGDSTAFDVFDWPVLAGNPATALVAPNSIVLTKRVTQKYFGEDNPIGETLTLDSDEPFQVTAVIDLPANSHFKFDAMISMSTFRARRPQIFDSWGYVDFYTYFTTHPDSDIDKMQEAIPDFIERQASDGEGYTIAFEPLANAYLKSPAGRQPGAVGSLSNIYIFVSVAIFILLIACINFINLSTSRSVERAKEVAIRKTIGSGRGALVAQFLVETILLTSFSSLIALGMIALALPYLELLSGKTLPIQWLLSNEYLLLALLFILTIGLLAGAYPAIMFSKFQPVKVLKGSFKTSGEGVWLRKSLVILQFTLSVILLVGASVIDNQLDHLRQYDMGFDPEQVLVIDYGWDGQVQRNLQRIKMEFLKHPDVKMISASRATPGDFFPNGGTGVEERNGEIVFRSAAVYEVDEDFIPTYDMTMAAGRNFSKDFPTDSATALLLNEAAAKMYGYANSEDIVGKKFNQWGRQGRVIGVVKDFNYVSLHEDVEPLALRYGIYYNTSMLSIRLISQNHTNTLQELEVIWNELVPHRPFLAHFEDDKFNDQYQADERFGMIVATFSGLAILVACLGLFGLTVYSTAQRAKEIGIRKVLGAPVFQIVALLSKDFMMLFITSLIISIPLSWYLMSSWLDSFAYRISMGWQLFAIAAVITLLISLLTISWKTVSTALANPVKSLRDE